MNDDFMTHYQPQVRLGFETTLRATLHTRARQQRRRQQMLVILGLFAVLLSITISMPAVRAQVRWLVREVGGITFVETENPREDWEAIRAAFVTPTPEPTPSDYHGDYRIEEVIDEFPYMLDAPVWEPDAYVQDAYAYIQGAPHGLHITFKWHPKACEMCNTYITFEMEPLSAQHLATTSALEGIAGVNIERVRIRNATAMLLHFAAQEAGENAPVWTLIWREKRTAATFEYRLYSNDPHLTHTDIIRMANSTGYGKLLANIRQKDRGLPMLKLSDILEVYPDITNFLPTWVPKEFIRDDNIGVDPENGRAVMIWRIAGAEDLTYPYPSFTFSVGRPWEIPMIAEPNTVKEVQVGHIPAAMWHVAHLNNPQHDPEGQYYTLLWLQNEMEYAISWREPGITFDTILKVAESIPHTPLPVDPDDLDDVLRLFLAEH